jgi:ABC-type uncharacterized transport system ATPase subunit
MADKKNSIRFIFEGEKLIIKFKVGDNFLYKDGEIIKESTDDNNSIEIPNVEKFIKEIEETEEKKETEKKKENKQKVEDLNKLYKEFKIKVIDEPQAGGAPIAHSNYEQQIDELRQQIKELKNANDEAAAAQKMGGGSAGGKKKSKTHTVRSKDYFLI